MFVLPFPFRSCGCAASPLERVERIGMEWVFNKSVFDNSLLDSSLFNWNAGQFRGALCPYVVHRFYRRNDCSIYCGRLRKKDDEPHVFLSD